MYQAMTDEDREKIEDLIRVAESNPKLAALTIINLQGVIHDMEDHAISSAHADDIVNSMREAYLG